MLQHKEDSAASTSAVSTAEFPAEELANESPAQPLEVPAKEVVTHQTQVAGVDQDLDAIKVSSMFVKEDLCVPEGTTDNKFTIEGIDLTDVYDEDNIAVDPNSSLQELTANSSCGKPLTDSEV